MKVVLINTLTLPTLGGQRHYVLGVVRPSVHVRLHLSEILSA